MIMFQSSSYRTDSDQENVDPDDTFNDTQIVPHETTNNIMKA